MSLLSIKKKATGLGAAKQSISALLQGQGADLSNTTLTNNLIALESLDDNARSDLEMSFESNSNEIKHILEENLGEGFAVTQVGLEAAAIAALANGNPAVYAQRAMSVSVEGNTSLPAFGSAGSMDFRLSPSSEAFDESELRKFAPHSIVFNALAAVQDPFAEAFFPTYVMSPDNAGAEVSVQRTMVFNEVTRSATGSITNFGKVNLVDAVQDASILENQTTDLVPVYLADDSRAEFFVDTDVLAPADVKVDGDEFKTSALRVDAQMDLVSLATGPNRINSQIDSTDSIDGRVELKTVYVLVRDAANQADPATGESDVLEIQVKGLPRTTFQPTAEGDSREMALTFANNAVLLASDTKAVDQSKADALAGLNDYVASLDMKLNGTLNVETGALEINASPLRVNGLVDASGAQISTTQGDGKAAIDSFSMEVIGYKLDARLTNANRRTRGILIDRTEVKERYTVPLGAPISAPQPIHGSSDQASDLRALVTTARTRTSNNAVTTLLNYVDSLRSTVARATATGTAPQVQGIGRLLVKRYFQEETIDAAAVINSTKSHEKASDFSAILVDAIRQIAYKMMDRSNYAAALEMETGGTSVKPKLIIGTDHVIAQHIMVSGDERTASIGMDFEVVSSPDARMSGKIVLGFGRGASGKPDALGFGTHFYMPELTSTAQVSRDNATTKETQVQPRDLHVPHLPVMGVINVSNIDKVFTDYIGGVPTRS